MLSKAAPVLFGFFIMGFCDVVGIATSYVQTDFGLSESLAGFIPSMVFLWFLFLSIPIAYLMNRIDRKKMVVVGNIITIIGMLIPFAHYTFITCLIAFALLGIGNTVLQVALNPLLTNVVKGKALSSSLTGGQVIKAVSSFSGPFIAVFAVSILGNWIYLFPIFALITAISTIWLMTTRINETKPEVVNSSFSSSFAILKDNTILILFLGILAVVGVDVGLNTLAPKLLIERCSLPIESAGYGSSVYFFCRVIGAFIGTFLLTKFSDRRYYLSHIVLALIALGILFFVQDKIGIFITLGLCGYAVSSIFAVIYSQAMKHLPTKTNEVSGLMITGVFGGAIVPPLMGVMADAVGSQIGSLLVITACAVYLLICGLNFKSNKISNV